MSTPHPAFTPSPATDALLSLTAARAVPHAEFVADAPDSPGVVGVHVDLDGARRLGLTDRALAGGLVYVIAAPESLRDRTVRAHFQSGRTAASHLRAGLAALLSEDLELDGVPRSPGVSGRRGLTSDAEEELTAWMRAHLRLSWWEAPEGVDAAEVAAAVTRELSPALHSTGVDRPWDRLAERRRAIVERARRSATL
ncbi:GIY-YIG nuclease family protein [Micrococcus sp.]|uniref:GIY-YIG nuclease family protein n=1 Tax=Micrococcus sp. TaxID=1271 RepID=UPI0026DBFCA7|nr:hypothetical protein [Micrococcus sp.]MDO4238712.1 hypothetical protein [Micrococcus sp.]